MSAGEASRNGEAPPEQDEKPREAVVQVVLDLPLDGPLSYLWPEEWGPPLAGAWVLAPLGKRKVSGIVLETAPAEGAPPVEELKPLVDLLDPRPVLTPDLLALVRWAAEYYCAPLHQMIRTALPWSGSPRDVRELRATGKTRQLILDPEARRGLSGRCLEIAEVVAAVGVIELKGLQKILGAVSLHQAIQRLARDGWIEAEYRLAGRGERTRRHYVLELTPEGREQLERCTPEGPKWQRILLRLAAAGGSLPQAEIGRAIPSPHQPIKRLLEQRLIRRRLEALRRKPTLPAAEGRTAPELLPEQRRAFDAVRESFFRFQVFLLHGVTGSGKTEVYLRLMEEVLARGRSGLVLVPEIALTPQIISRFRGRFGDNLAVLHSGLRAGERYDEWNELRQGTISIAVGARSALFAPLERLGLIVVDEEHDQSYKQDRTPFYNGRDLAVVRARHADCPVLLGSATPSAESWFNATHGKRYRLLRLTRRVQERELPVLHVLPPPRRKQQLLAPELETAIVNMRARGEQAILLLNRRGFAPYVTCPHCGHVIHCEHCSLTMVYHADRGQLICHCCSAVMPTPERCPRCGYKTVLFRGVGTQRLEQYIKRQLPGVRVLRLDSDVARTRGARRRTLEHFRRGEADLLIGTQMVAKGHDFPRVTLVGVLGIDALLSLPDFRAAERAFSLLVQAAGRAGRGQRRGTCFIQTRHTEHYALKRALQQDVPGFYAEELLMRSRIEVPPFRRLALLRVESDAQLATRLAAEQLADALSPLLSPPLRLFGPLPAPVIKRKDTFRWQLLLKSSSSRELTRILHEALELAPLLRKTHKARLLIDRDPQGFI
jgi:primosomal protein N' (replication factor Y)